MAADAAGGAGAPFRAAVAAALLALAAAPIGFAWKTAADPATAYLAADPAARWILYPSPREIRPHAYTDMRAIFRRRVSLAAAPPAAALRLRAFGRPTLTVNGQAVPLDAGGSSAIERSADLASLLRAGENEIVAEVVNDRGPPALWLSVVLPDRTLFSDADWEVSLAGAAWRPAGLADRPRPGGRFDPYGQVPDPWRALVTRWRTIAWCAALAGIIVAGAFMVGRRLRPLGRGDGRVSWTPRAASLLALVIWVALFLHDRSQVPPRAGFDAPGHIEYVRYVLDRGTLPLADEGWEMYQAPLFYVLAAGVLRVAGLAADDPGAPQALRLLGLALGALNLWCVSAALRRVFPEHPRRQLIGLATVTALPPLLFLYQYVSNEGLVITLSSLTVWMLLRTLDRVAVPLWECGLLGASLGAAMLAKVSALVLWPVVIGTLGFRAAFRPRRAWARAAAELAVVVGVAVAVCGWQYARVWAHFGTPFVTNLDPQGGGVRLWQEPGYRMLSDYRRFGAALRAPFLAALDGMWDGLYSTMWGDGFGSGEPNLHWAPPWSLDLMAAGYLLAVVPTVAMIVGLLAATVTAIRRPGVADVLRVGLPLFAVGMMVPMSLHYPLYRAFSAFYVFPALVPLVAFIALGVDLMAGRRVGRAVVVLTLFGTWALTSCAAFWIDEHGPRGQTALGLRLMETGKPEEGRAHVRAAVALDPDDWYARGVLARDAFARGAAREEIERIVSDGPMSRDSAYRHYFLGMLAMREQAADTAVAEVRQAIALDPDHYDAYGLLAELLERRGDLPAAVDAWREALRVNPFSIPVHRALSRLYERLGADDAAAMHRDYAARLLS